MTHRWPTVVGIALLAFALVFNTLGGWAARKPVVHSRFVAPLATAAQTPATPYGSSQATSTSAPSAELQSLSWMEEALLGAPQSTLPVAVRLTTLEETFFGVAYPFEATAQRLARLDNALLSRKDQTLRKRQADEVERQAALQPTLTDEWDETSALNPHKLTNPSTYPANKASALPARLRDPASGQPAMGLPAGQVSPTAWSPPPQASEYSPNPSQGWESTPSPEVMNESLLTLEKSVLKATYPSEMPTTRLDRLETAVFHRTAGTEGLSEDERLQRLIAVASAQADSNYERTVNSPSGSLKSLWPMLPIILLMLL
ncbi:MAG: hypothetical protein QE263_05620 [Vampirovibrionales bacterium]|nr:hypothetical protein [Vampirovibrionales bacterium]